ncbi:MAG: aminoacyl-tRNA hydrolase [Clostridiales bacterium]|nr:aminoacyl-tRNA hydrolase [Clostridiales bacterium]
MADIFDLFKKIEKQPQAPLEPISFILVGLGNPGNEYTFTRHNAGFMTIDYLMQKYNFKVDRARFKALCGEVTIAGRRGLVMKPQTYMNASGEAVREAADFYKITPENIIAICDDINLEPGSVRVRKKGSDGGQKGLRSIIYQLGSDNFPRIRMGVGAKPHPDYDLADWVLGQFSEEGKKQFFTAMERVGEGLPTIISGDIDKAMNMLNAR